MTESSISVIPAGWFAGNCTVKRTSSSSDFTRYEGSSLPQIILLGSTGWTVCPSDNRIPLAEGANVTSMIAFKGTRLAKSMLSCSGSCCLVLSRNLRRLAGGSLCTWVIFGSLLPRKIVSNASGIGAVTVSIRSNTNERGIYPPH